jgi:hypothetical protein
LHKQKPEAKTADEDAAHDPQSLDAPRQAWPL